MASAGGDREALLVQMAVGALSDPVVNPYGGVHRAGWGAVCLPSPSQGACPSRNFSTCWRTSTPRCTPRSWGPKRGSGTHCSGATSRWWTAAARGRPAPLVFFADSQHRQRVRLPGNTEWEVADRLEDTDRRWYEEQVLTAVVHFVRQSSGPNTGGRPPTLDEFVAAYPTSPGDSPQLLPPAHCPCPW